MAMSIDDRVTATRRIGEHIQDRVGFEIKYVGRQPTDDHIPPAESYRTNQDRHAGRQQKNDPPEPSEK